MDKKEIFDMVIREMMERALEIYREKCDETEQKLYKQIVELSKQREKVLDKLAIKERQILDDYFIKTSIVIDRECAYLYIQGAKDCVEMFKKLGVF